MDSWPLELSLAAAWPFHRWKQHKILMAVSGGADSTALSYAMKSIAKDSLNHIFLGHFNHQLRGEESDQDEQFVRNLAKELNWQVVIGKANTTAISVQRGDGIEEAARHLRYDFFRETAQNLGARYLVTAHTANDQVETILYRTLRGTGISGLAGISQTRAFTPEIGLIRPLLNISRKEILEYLQQINKTYREDSSNQDQKFSRNYLRHQLLPELRAKFSSNVDQSLLRLGQVAENCQDFVRTQAANLLDQVVVQQTIDMVILNRHQLQQAHPFLITETFFLLWERKKWPRQEFGSQKVNQLVDLTKAQHNSTQQVVTIQLPGKIQVIFDFKQIRLSRL